ncbi:MAG: protein translocase subunit SecD, partial [Rhodanobacteraceae bacterium]|nr:protein translocase subunit SecD [Rhodanobacteraceae bacterium]
MNDFPRWKSALVVVVLLLGILYGVPNLFVQQPAVQVTANRGATIDEALKERVQGVLEKDKITFQGIEFDKDHMLVRLPIGASDDQNKALEAMKAELGEQYVVAPNLASTVPSWMLAIGAREMPKGLDLQGGVHFLMEVDDKDVMDKQVQRYADDIRGVLREKNIRYQSVNRGAKGVVVQLRSAEERDAARAAIQVKVPDVVV